METDIKRLEEKIGDLTIEIKSLRKDFNELQVDISGRMATGTETFKNIAEWRTVLSQEVKDICGRTTKLENKQASWYGNLAAAGFCGGIVGAIAGFFGGNR